MILLTGATGFLGRNLFKRMLKANLSVRCLVRTHKKGEALKSYGAGVELVTGDITDKESLKNAMEDIKIVVHLVGIIVETGKAAFDLIHVHGTKNMVEAAVEAGAQRFIHMSALGARPDARSRYHMTKWAAEEIVRNSGMKYAIFRPSVIFGKEDNFTNMFAKAVKISPFVMVPGNGRNMMQPVSVNDVAEVFTMAVKDDNFKGSYELGGTEKLTFDEIIDKICYVLGRKRMKVHIPLSLLNPMAWVMESVLPKPPLTRDQLLMLQEDNVTRDNALEQVFGIKPGRFEDGIREYLVGG